MNPTPVALSPFRARMGEYLDDVTQNGTVYAVTRHGRGPVLVVRAASVRELVCSVEACGARITVIDGAEARRCAVCGAAL